jgi:hypothetical protein
MVKPLSWKKVYGTIPVPGDWSIVWGRLERTPGRPGKVSPLFEVIAEKLPFESLGEVSKLLKQEGVKAEGVYLAHDSMGSARYGGRGQIITRLSSHKAKYPTQLSYFSFYIIPNKIHEREIETAILRAAGPLLVFNKRKIRQGIEPGSVSDYEAGAYFIERQHKRGKKKQKTRGRPRKLKT